MLQLHQRFMKFSTTNLRKIFRGIIPEKYRYFPGNFRKNPRSRLQPVYCRGQGHIVSAIVAADTLVLIAVMLLARNYKSINTGIVQQSEDGDGEMVMYIILSVVNNLTV